MPKLVLFDIDGTLLLTAGAGRRAITRALARVVGEGVGFDTVRFDGKTDPQIVTELLNRAGHPRAGEPEFVRQLCDQYVAVLEQELVRSEVTLLPGVLSLLDRLEGQAGVLLGLLTGNVARGAALKLAAAGLGIERFRVGAFGSDSAHRPDLPPIAARRAAPHFGREPRGGEIVIIGDTPADVTCGCEVGARAIGVATGSYPIGALAGAGAHAVFADLSDTESVLEAVLA